MGERTAFFYGTLMAQEVLYRVIFGSSTLSKHNVQQITTNPAILHHHRRSRVALADYPAVIPATGFSVRGTYVTGLTDGDMFRLDMFEGSQYKLEKARVSLLKSEGDAATGDGNVEGEQVDTETYIWVSPHDELEDAEWDYETFRKERLGDWASHESTEYAEVDAWAEKAEEDGADPTGGRGRGGHISRALEDEHTKVKQEQDEDGEPFKSAV